MTMLLDAPVAMQTMSKSTAPVRVCFVIDDLSRAGTESQLLALIRNADRERVEPSLVLLNGDNAVSQELEPSDCPILRLGIRKLVGRQSWSAAQRLKQFWREHPADLLQAYFLDSAYFTVPIGKVCGIRKVVRVRNNLGYWLSRKHRILGRMIAPWVDVTLTNSQLGVEALRAEGTPTDSIVSIENGVDLERFENVSPPMTSSVPRVGCVANLRQVKNIDGLLRAFRKVVEAVPNAELHIGGDGPEREALQTLQRELGIACHWHGSVSDVPAFLASIDIAVLPSHSEGMSNALLEYMAAGRAIVATDVGANAYLVDGNSCGRLVPPGSDSALSVAIVELIENPATAQEFASSARQRVTDTFSRAVMCERFVQFYETLIRD